MKRVKRSISTRKQRASIDPLRAFRIPKKFDGTSGFEIEPEIVEWANFEADQILKRYDENPRLNWGGKDRENKFWGLLGEKIFQATLQQLRIPHLYDDPTLKDEWYRLRNDFYVADRSIQVKTVPPGEDKIRLMVRVDQTWTKPDFVIAIKIHSLSLAEAEFMGYLTGDEVEKLPIRDFGKSPCHWCFLEDLHPFEELIEHLKKISPPVEVNRPTRGDR